MMAKAGPWIGWVIAALLAIMFAMSAFMKLFGGAEVSEGMAKFGLPESMLLPLAIVELTCLVAYLVPATSVLGAILLTGYLGGAICTHWRVADSFVTPAVMGVLVWVGVCLREPRLWSLVPLRKKSVEARVASGG